MRGSFGLACRRGTMGWYNATPVGWVEGREAHHDRSLRPLVGLAALDPPYTCRRGRMGWYNVRSKEKSSEQTSKQPPP